MPRTELKVNPMSAIRADRLMEHVRALSAPEMRGRMPGDVGYERASLYLESRLDELGLRPLGDDGGWRQTFRMETSRVTRAGLTARLPGEPPWELELGRDYVLRGLTGGGRAEGPMVFVGHGRTEPVDELAGVDLEGRVVVAFKHPPPWEERPVPPLPRERGRLFQERGARGLLLVPSPLREIPDRLGASLVERGAPLPGFPMAVLSAPAGRRLLRDAGETLSGLQWQIEQERRSASRPLPGEIRLGVSTESEEEGLHWSILAGLPGKDPEKSREAILLGAHLDHVGIQGESVIFPGAQDNASGVAALIEVARALRQGPSLGRTVLMAFFGAEEAGILGSRHYAAHPPWPLEQTRVMLNLDCVGAGAGLDSRGRMDHPELFEIHDRLNRTHLDLPDRMADLSAGGADAQPFQEAGIPNLYLVASQAYDQLHMAGDTADTLNPPLLEGITRLAYLMAVDLAGS